MTFKMKDSVRNKFEELMDVFDWDYIKDLFIQGDKIGAFPKDKLANRIYQLGGDGYVYIISRERAGIMPPKVVKQQ